MSVKKGGTSKIIITTWIVTASLAALAILLIFAVVTFVPTTSQIVQYPRDIGSYDEIYYFTFEPADIFILLDRGDNGIFKSISEPVEENLFPPSSFPWRQSDYLKAVIALNQFVQKDDLDDWKIFEMIFERDCGDNPVGFDNAEITYFKTSDLSSYYIAREIDIYPLQKEARWGGNTYFPRSFFGWKSVNLKKLKVTADDALQMAEANGAKEARQAANNGCQISIFLGPNTSYDAWHILYYNSGSHLFEMTVDPFTGKYQIFTPDE